MSASEIVIAPHTLATGSYSITAPLAYGRPVIASDLACFREIGERLFHRDTRLETSYGARTVISTLAEVASQSATPS